MGDYRQVLVCLVDALQQWAHHCGSAAQKVGITLAVALGILKGLLVAYALPHNVVGDLLEWPADVGQRVAAMHTTAGRSRRQPPRTKY